MSLAMNESEVYFRNQIKFFENDVKQIFARIMQKLKASNKSSGQMAVTSEFCEISAEKETTKTK